MIIYLVIGFSSVFFIESYGQMINSDFSNKLTTDSLSLNQIISSVIQNHPSVKEAEEAINAADAKINIAKAGYLPYINVTGSYTRIGPVPGIEFNNVKFQMAPENVYNSSLNYNQNIYDFGRTSRDVVLQKENKNLAQNSIDQLKQSMTLLVTSTFYSLVYLQDALAIKNDQLKTLKEHLDFIEKKKETGSATEYEVLSTQVKISNVESQKIDLETARLTMISVINSLLGQPETTSIAVKKELNTHQPQIVTDSLLSYAIRNRDEIKIAYERAKIANLTYQFIQAQYNPMLGIYASAGYKNGYFPDLNKMTANYAAGIGLTIPIFNATKIKNNLRLTNSQIQSANYELEVVKRNITNEVVQANANLSASQEKIRQFELQLSQAKKALSLAEISYKSGVITNLDLMDATTAVSESQLSLLKAQIDYVVNSYKLKVAIGEKLY
jgi:outer membrane protein TolC